MYCVGSAQINNGFSGQYYFPYSIGILQAYLRKHLVSPENYAFSPTIYKRLVLSEAVERLIDNDIVLFSTYVWNINISLKIAQELKVLKEDIFIVFGGPSVPDSAEEFLLSNDYIDVVCHQEGERTITSILNHYPIKRWRDTPGISYLDKDRQFRTNVSQPRMRDISVIPSPYLDGVFDSLIESNPEEKWLSSWETNRGCPFACAFCDWGSAINSKVSRMEMDKLRLEIEWFAQRKIEFIFLCDANFGMLKRDYDIAQMAIEVRQKYGYPHVLSVQTTKNARERSYKIQKLLYEGGLHKSVNLAMQSTNPHTLQQIKRGNISIDDYRELQRRFLRDGIPTYSDLIIGLPGDNYESFINSVEQLISSGQHYRIQYNNLSILPNAEMAEPEYRTEHQIKTVQIPIVNMHGSVEDLPDDEILEHQELVIGTKDLSTKQWIRMRQYATTTEFFYFNKILQIPILLCNVYEEISYREIFEKLMSIEDSNKYPVLSTLNRLFVRHAVDITNGGAEFIESKNWLDIYWPPGEYAILYLVKKKLVEKFYRESNFVLNEIIGRSRSIVGLIDDAVEFNKALLCLPGKLGNIELELNFDIESIYRSSLVGEIKKLETGKFRYVIDREKEQYEDEAKWAREVIWYGHRRGAYLYGIEPMSKDIAGHY